MPDQFTDEFMKNLGVSQPGDGSQYATQEDQTADILNDLGLTKKKGGDHSWPVAVAIKAAANTTPGLALRALGEWDYEEQDLGLIGNTAAGIGSFLGDPLTYALGGVGGAVGGRLAQGMAKGAARTALEHGALGAIQLGGLEAIHDPLRQYVETGEVDPLQTAGNVVRSTALGAGFGPLANIGGPAKAAAEVALLGAGEPLLHGEAPSVDSMLSGFATVVGLKSVNALVKIGSEGRQKLIDSREGRRAAGLQDASPSAKEFRELGLDELADKPRSVRDKAVDAAEAIEALSKSPGDPLEAPRIDAGTKTLESVPATAEETARAVAEASPVGQPEIVTVPRGTSITSTEPETRNAIEESRQVKEVQAETQAQAGQAQGQDVLTGPPDAVSLKNAFTENERSAMGLPPRMAPLRQSDPQTFDLAMKEIAANPDRQDVLIAEMKANPRAGTAVESMLLLHREAELSTKINRVSLAAENARTAGDAPAEAVLASDLSMLFAKMDELFGVIESAGTEWGRIGHIRQSWMAEDYSLSRIMRMAKQAKGSDLTPEEVKEVGEVAKKVQALTPEAERADVVEAGKKALGDIQAAVQSKREKQSKSKRADEVRKEIDDIWKELGDKYGGGQMFASPLGPLLAVPDAVRLAGKYIKLGMATVKDFLDEVKARMGSAWSDAMVPNLEAGWKQAVEEAKPKPRQVTTSHQMSRHARELAEYHVSFGVDTLKGLIDAVHADLKRVDPNITRRGTMEAFSNYGKYRPPPDDPVKRVLYDLRRQAQEVAKLQDIKEGRAPLMTGSGRPEPSDTERHLTKRVREAMKRAGLAITDPVRQIKSALSSKKTRMKNQIKDLDKAIRTNTRLSRKKPSTDTDKALQDLIARRDQLKSEYDNIFGKRTLTDEQRLKIAIASEKRIAADVRKRINAGEFGPKPKGTTKDWASVSTEYTAARAERKAAQAELRRLRDLANPKKTAEERAMSAYHANLRRRIADYEKRSANNQFEPPPKPLPRRDSESERLRFQLEKVKKDFHAKLDKWRRQNRTVVEKIFGIVPETSNAARALMTSMDFSAVLRQGGFLFAAHPIRSLRAIPDMVRAAFSERGMSRVFHEISERPNAKSGLYKRAKLELTDPHGPLSRMEEAFMSRLAERIPGVAGSSRAYITFLNRVRADAFDAMVATLGKRGTISEAEAKVVANFVNAATGRGNLGRFTQASTTLATVFFAPKYVISRFQMLLLQPLWRGNLSTKTAIAKEYARALTGLGVFYGVSNLALNGLIGPPGKEWNIELNPRSSDFGKIRIGPTRIDPLAGFQQAAVLMSRLATGETKTIKGKIQPIRGKVRYGREDSADVIARFLRTKLSPPLGTSMDVLSGKDVVGQDVTPQSVASRLLIPLSYQDIYDAMIAQGIPEGTAMGLLSLFGMSVQTYGK